MSALASGVGAGFGSSGIGRHLTYI